MDPTFSLLDALVFPDDPSTPTSPSFSNPFTAGPSAVSSSSSSSSTAFDLSAASQLDFSNPHDPWEGFPASDYTDYDSVSYGGGMMGLDLGSMGGGGGGVELMDIGESFSLLSTRTRRRRSYIGLGKRRFSPLSFRENREGNSGTKEGLGPSSLSLSTPSPPPSEFVLLSSVALLSIFTTKERPAWVASFAAIHSPPRLSISLLSRSSTALFSSPSLLSISDPL